MIETNEYHHIVQFAIEQLPPRRRLIYQLNREQGLDYQQIADELSISRHTVKNQLSTALQSIRRVLLQAARIFSEKIFNGIGTSACCFVINW